LTDFLAPAQAPDELGRLGPYRVLKVLGCGGMGVVFQAEDPQLQRLLALKAMLPALAASDSARKRFLREARAAAAVEHDHIVAIFQVGEDRGVPYLAMPFLAGETLAERVLREGPLEAGEVLRIGRETAEGLAAAHDRGLIHRDIKPANLWLEGTRRRVKILDFGLARAAADPTQLTVQGAVVGTPAFIAPEQATGQAVDSRCDLFSLGCVLYYLCTGQLPFNGSDTIATLLAVATEHPRPPQELNPAVPSALSDLVMRLLAKNPNDRPASAHAVVQAIQAIEKERTVAGDPALIRVMAKPAAGTGTVSITPPTFRKRLRWGVIAAGAGLVGALGLVVLVLLLNWEPEKPPLVKKQGDNPETNDKKRRDAGGNRDNNPRPKPVWPPEEPTDKAMSPLAVVSHPARLKGVHSWTVETRGHRGAIRAVAFHPEEKILASAGLDGSIRLWNTDTGKLLRILVGHAGPVNALAWSPTNAVAIQPEIDKLRLASASEDGTVRLWDVASGNGKILRSQEGPVSAVGWIDGGKSLAARTGVNTVSIWAKATGKRRRRLRELGLDASSLLAWSPDGQLLATSHATKQMVKVWKASTGELPRSLQNPARLGIRGNSFVIRGNSFVGLDWSGDSRTVASCTRYYGTRGFGIKTRAWISFRIDRWSAAKGTKPISSVEIPRPRSRRFPLSTIIEWERMRMRLGFFQKAFPFPTALEPQGKLLVACAPTDILFADMTSRQTQLVPFQTSSDPVSALAFAPDGKTFAAGNLSGDLCYWDFSKKQIRLTVPGCSPIASDAAMDWSPRGKRLAICPWEPVHIWDVKAGTSRLCGRTGDPLAWSPDGKTLATNSGNGPVLWKTASGEQIPTKWAGVQLPRQRARFLQFASLNRSARSLAGVQLRRRRDIRVQILPVQALAWSAGGRRLAWSSGYGNLRNGQLMINRVPSGEHLAKSKGTVPGVTALAWSHNGRFLASNGTWGTKRGTKPTAANEVLLWKIQKGALEPQFLSGHQKPVTAVAWSPGGAMLASGSQDQTVILWKDGKLLATLKAKQGEINALRWLSERQLVSLATDGTVCFWDVAGKKRNRSFRVAAGSGAISPDGRTLAGLSGQAVRLWELAKGRQMATLLFLRSEKVPRCLAVSPSGHYRGPKGVEGEIVYVVQTAGGQETLTAGQFAQKYHWKNDPKRVRLTGK
jgi:WD40 repeat protein